MWNNTFSGESDWQELVWRLSNNEIMRKQPQGGLNKRETLLRFASEPQLLQRWAVQRRMPSAPPISFISFAIWAASMPSSLLFRTTSENKISPVLWMGDIFNLFPVKIYYRRISLRKFSHLMVRTLIPWMGNTPFIFYWYFLLKGEEEHLIAISTGRPTLKPNSLRRRFCTKFCGVCPLPKVLELFRNKVRLPWLLSGHQ